MHNVIMRIPADRGDGTREERQVQFSRGGWRSEDSAGAVRAAGWWESVTVTRTPVPAPPGRRSALMNRALATAVDLIAPALADLAAAAAMRALQRQYRHRRLPLAPRRYLPPAARAIPRSDRTA
jgi:hypothetical protein